MKKAKRTFEGKEFEFIYPDALEVELGRQLNEIFKVQHYKNGRRKKNAVYLDIGANVGMATRYFHPYAKKIYAIEPNPEIYQALVENTKDLKGVETFNYAIAQINGTTHMFSNSGGDLPQSFYGDSSSAFQILVNMKSLDSVFKENKIEHIDVMKIDVEGGEYIIFASDSFLKVADKIDYIIGESHFIEGAFPDVLKPILKDAGFKHFRFIKDMGYNYYRNMEYLEVDTGVRKKWSFPYYTLFEAWH